MSRRFEGAREISVHEPKGRIKGDVFGFPGASLLMAFPHRTYITVRNRTVKCDRIAVIPVHELKVAHVEVTMPPVPHLGVGHRINRQLLSCVSIRT